MTIPHLPDDVLSEVLSHFCAIDVEVPLPSACWDEEDDLTTPTPTSQAMSLLLVSRRFRSLVEPFIWRTIVIGRPTDFTLFFAPGTGLLHANGEVGSLRRRWVREFVLGCDAALPLDPSKIDRQIRLYDGLVVDEEEDMDIHAELLPVELPNLKRLQIGHARYLGPTEVRSDPALGHRYKVIIDIESSSYENEVPFEEEYLFPWYRWLWMLLARRNDVLFATFLSSFTPTLVVFQAPLLSTTRRDIMPSNWTLLDRLPVGLKHAPANLVVVLDTCEPPDPWPLPTDRGLPTVDELRALVERLPDGAQVDVYRARWMEGREWKRELTEDEKEDEKPNEWDNWSWVDEGGDHSAFTYESLRRLGPATLP